MSVLQKIVFQNGVYIVVVCNLFEAKSHIAWKLEQSARIDWGHFLRHHFQKAIENLFNPSVSQLVTNVTGRCSNGHNFFF